MPFCPTCTTKDSPNITTSVPGTTYIYNNPEDTLATIKASGYFDPAVDDIDNITGNFKVNDIIYIVGSDGSDSVKITALNPITVTDSTITSGGTHTTTWSGIWAGAEAGNIDYQLADHQVLLNIPSVLANSTVGAHISSDVALDVSLRPTADTTIPLFVKDDQAAGDYSDGTAIIKTTGIIEVYLGRGTGGVFAGISATGTSGIVGIPLTYYV